MITHEKLVDVLEYDAFTGKFTWRARSDVPKWWNTKYAGKQAGNQDAHGYITLCIDGRAYKAHRMAWLYITGYIPSVEIDHKDGVRENNAFSNLRLATDLQNAVNAKKRSDNNSGFKGVSWHASSRKWQAQINVNGLRKSLGYFSSPKAASDVYLAKAAELHGEFVRFE